MVPWATRVHNPNGILIGSAVFAEIVMTVTQSNRWTDHTTASVTTGYIYVVQLCNLTLQLLVLAKVIR